MTGARLLLTGTLMLFAACGDDSSSADIDAAVSEVECVNATDCGGELSCSAGRCVTASCDDNEQGAGETDIDCGGDCRPCTEGQSCGDAGDCASSFCDDGVCRDCQAAQDCAAVPETQCLSGVCRGDAPLGNGCSTDGQCASGFCVDSVCCDAPCGGACESCLGEETGATSGTCSPALVDTDPRDQCTQDTPQSCGLSGACNGSGACSFYPSTTICGPRMCLDSTTLMGNRRCSGGGTCQSGEIIECDFQCEMGRCDLPEIPF